MSDVSPVAQPRPAPPAPLPSRDEVRTALAAELERTKRELWVERALRVYPALAGLGDLASEVLGATSETVTLQKAAKLAVFSAPANQGRMGVSRTRIKCRD